MTSMFPFEIKDVSSELAEELMEKFKGVHNGLVQVGPEKYFFPSKFKEEAALYYNFTLRPDDVWVVTFPRSGTTWVQDIVWLIANDLDFETARTSGLGQRYSFLEFSAFLDEDTQKDCKNPQNEKVLQRIADTLETLNSQKTRRFIKSHLAFSLLPPKLLDTSKVVYVARDPRDVALSYFRHQRLVKLHSYVGDFKTFWNYFVRGLVNHGPYFPHIKEAWEKRNNPNLLFLYYEDLCHDLPNCLKRIAKFLNKELTDKQISELTHYFTFDNFKQNAAVNGEVLTTFGLTNEGEKPFFFQAVALSVAGDAQTGAMMLPRLAARIPKARYSGIRQAIGKAGGWKEHFDEDLKTEASEWMKENLDGFDIKFPL